MPIEPNYLGVKKSTYFGIPKQVARVPRLIPREYIGNLYKILYKKLYKTLCEILCKK